MQVVQLPPGNTSSSMYLMYLVQIIDHTDQEWICLGKNYSEAEITARRGHVSNQA